MTNRIRSQSLTRYRRRVVTWGGVVLGIAALVIAGPWGLLPLPDLHRVVVRSGLPETVMIDHRTIDARGGVTGPPIQPLEPGQTIAFTTHAGAQTCIRIMTGEEGRMTAVGIPADARARETRFTLQPSLLTPRPDASLACPEYISGHRVRTSWGRYFEQGAPDQIFRERLLRRVP